MAFGECPAISNALYRTDCTGHPNQTLMEVLTQLAAVYAQVDQAAIRLCPMNPGALPTSIVTTDSATALTAPGSAVDESPITLPATRLPVDARGLALAILAAIALVFALSWAQTFVVPLLVSIVVSYTLNPLVTWLEAIKIPRALGAVIVMAGVIGALVFGTYSLRGQMQTILEQLPEAATNLSTGLARMRISQIGTVQTYRTQRLQWKGRRLKWPAALSIHVNVPLT